MDGGGEGKKEGASKQTGKQAHLGRVGAALVAREVDEGELAVERAARRAQQQLEDGVRARRVVVGRRRARRAVLLSV